MSHYGPPGQHRGGGGGYSRGGGGYGRGDARGGRQGERSRYNAGDARRFKERFMVNTNCFKASYQAPVNSDTAWYCYMIDITPKKYVTEKMTNDGVLPAIETLPNAHENKIERFQASLQENGSNKDSRKILNKLSDFFRSENKHLVTDGASIGYTPQKLFEGEEQGYGISLDLNRSYWVTLYFQGTISLRAWKERPTTPQEIKDVERIVHCIDTIFKHGFNANLISVGKNPSTFFLKEDAQWPLLRQVVQRGRGQPVFERYYNRPSVFAPYIGISQSVRYCQGGSFIVPINNKMEWMFRDNGNTGRNGSGNDQKVDIPILDVENRTLAGIRLPNLDRKLEEAGLRKRIEDALSKLTFKVKYTKGEGWVQSSKTRGKSEGYIQRNRTHTNSEQRMSTKDEKPKLKWSCEDESFEKKDGEKTLTYTIQSYFENIYDVKIRFPNLPIVNTRRGFYPVEFLYHEVAKVPIDTDQINQVLCYHDQYAGVARVDHIEKVKQIASESGGSHEKPSLEALCNAFSIYVESKPLSLEAKRLPPPVLQFAPPFERFGNSEFERNTHSGSWNLANKRFRRSAELLSYAVVDLGHRNHRNVKSSSHFMENLFKAMDTHGMHVRNDGRNALQDVTVYGDPSSGPAELFKLFGEARERARARFLKKNFFFTNVVIKEEDEQTKEIEEILDKRLVVLHPNGEAFAISLDTDEKTHMLYHHTDENKWAKGRIQFKLYGSDNWKDPNDIRPDDSDNIVDVGYETDHGFLHQKECRPNPPALHPLEEWQFECPAMVFFFLPEKRTDLYDCVKLISDLEFGINTQCIVQATYCSQKRGVEQYCSNVALKVNTKLSSRKDHACAWELYGGLPWVREVPTMVMGYSLSHGKINGRPATAIAGSVCLSKPMQMAQWTKLYSGERTTDVVDTVVLKDLVKALEREFLGHFQELYNEKDKERDKKKDKKKKLKGPKRIVVYRDGGSDGSFERILEKEVAAIREAICEVNRAAKDIDRCPLGCQSKNFECEHCEPPRITFVVAKKDHNMRIVPVKGCDQAFKNNVPSGTLVDGHITSYGDSEDTFDFLLTPQGGLKGTSKPMHFCVLANENALPPHGMENASALTKEKLYQITYHMAFQYGTATKAPRKVPVLLNSEKLAKRVIKYGGYLSYLTNSSVHYDEDTEQFVRTQQTAGDQTFTNDLFAPGYKNFTRLHITA